MSNDSRGVSALRYKFILLTIGLFYKDYSHVSIASRDGLYFTWKHEVVWDASFTGSRAVTATEETNLGGPKDEGRRREG